MDFLMQKMEEALETNSKDMRELELENLTLKNRLDKLKGDLRQD